MRSEKIWYKAIPELQNYKNKTILKNKQRAWITSGNMDFNIYNKIIEELKNAVHR
jgi:uncharacterized protein YecT (DUF1311 family)